MVQRRINGRKRNGGRGERNGWENGKESKETDELSTRFFAKMSSILKFLVFLIIYFLLFFLDVHTLAGGLRTPGNWSMRGIGKALQLLRDRREDGVEEEGGEQLNALLTYITLPWTSILEGAFLGGGGAHFVPTAVPRLGASPPPVISSAIFSNNFYTFFICLKKLGMFGWLNLFFFRSSRPKLAKTDSDL